jgi:hypothetical protein
MVKISFNCESGMDSVATYALFRALQKICGTPMGGCEEQASIAREVSLVLEFGGTIGNREREPGKLSV